MATTETKTSKRVVSVLSAIYFEPGTNVLGEETQLVRTGVRGQEIELTDREEKRLDDAGALLPKGSKPEDAEKAAQARLDAYRAQRGDQEALQRHVARVAEASGEIIDVDAPVDGTVAELAEWIKASKPNADDTVALAEGNPDRAQRVLDAESAATGGKPRKTVQEQLEKIVAG